ncbi:MAG: hypothetical protein NTV05_07830 [Acidobacteria bacterium]|nr:hypothetical protein [Acidobacteriota bacterium]
MPDTRLSPEDIKWLRGLVPICASCKKIRDQNGDWKDTGTHITADTGGAFSQGLCPECLKTLYPEFAND